MYRVFLPAAWLSALRPGSVPTPSGVFYDQFQPPCWKNLILFLNKPPAVGANLIMQNIFTINDDGKNLLITITFNSASVSFDSPTCYMYYGAWSEYDAGNQMQGLLVQLDVVQDATAGTTTWRGTYDVTSTDTASVMSKQQIKIKATHPSSTGTETIYTDDTVEIIADD